MRPLSLTLKGFRGIRDGLGRATSPSTKATWFNALRGIATTPETLDWLERVWRRDEAVPGLRLAESDEADLALDLAVRDVDNAEQILTAQEARLENPDRKARFAFVAPALSRDPQVFEKVAGAIAALKPADVDAFAREYFRPQNRVTITLAPKGGAK